jgi:hypothetical protein
MDRNQQDESGSEMPPGDGSPQSLEQERRALAHDIALLVVRQHRRGTVSGNQPADTRELPAQ